MLQLQENSYSTADVYKVPLVCCPVFAFMVLIEAHGWDPIRSTLRSYAQNPASGDVPFKQNSFVIRYGQAAKADVSDFFTKLGYPVTAETKQALKGLPVFTYTPPAPAGK